jgi:surface polysaccharide O-acyltransferase-like enzyme
MSATASDAGAQLQPAPRELWIDWFRAGGAVAIVALHVTAREMVRRYHVLEGFDWWTIAGYQAVTRSVVPLFVMISGYLILRRCADGRSASYAFRRAGRAYALALFWTLAFFAWERVKGYDVSAGTFITNALLGEPYYHLWFLYAIAGTYLIAPIIAPGLAGLQATQGRIVAWGIPLAATLHFMATRGDRPGSVIALSVPYVAFSATGYLMRVSAATYSRMLAPIMYVGGLAATLAGFAVLTGAGTVARGASNLHGSMWVFTPFSPSVVAMSIGAYLGLCGSRWLRRQQMPSVVARFASDSMGVYILHPFVLDVVNHLGFVGRTPNALVGIAGVTAVVTAITWALTIVYKQARVTRATVSF